MSTMITLTGIVGDYILARLVVDTVPRVGEIVSFMSNMKELCSIPVLNVSHQIRNEYTPSDVRVYVHLNIDDMALKELGFYNQS